MNTEKLEKYLKDNQPTIMMASGLGLIGYSIFEWVRNTPDAMRKIDLRKSRDNKKKLGVVGTVQATWKCYWRAVLADIGGAALIIAADREHVNRNTALLTGVTVAQEALREYKTEAKKLLGESKERDIERNIASNKMDEHPPENVITTVKGGTQRCYDSYCDRYFFSSADAIRKAGLETYRDLIRGMDVELDDFYFRLGLQGTALSKGRGWSAMDYYKGNKDNQEFLYIVAHMGEDGNPDISFRFDDMPELNYHRTDV